MARTVGNEEERLRRIYLIRDYALNEIANNKSFSTRSIAKYFTDNGIFSISNYTVDVYLNSLEKLDIVSYKKIRQVLDANIPKTVNDEEVINRIRKVVTMILNDYTVDQIATILNESPNTINKDLNSRLDKLCYSKEELEAIRTKLLEHSIKNLKNQSR